jgi:mannose-6-phosphate isomerase-like protein (cupin superfamily)
VFDTKVLSANPDVTAPDGSAVRILLGLRGGGLAHFELPPDEVSIAVHHRTVEEIWYVVGGTGLMWRSDGTRSAEVELTTGTCVTIPVGTTFQLRSLGPEPLAAIGITMPPWPGDGEAVRSAGPWEPTVAAGPGLAEG